MGVREESMKVQEGKKELEKIGSDEK